MIALLAFNKEFNKLKEYLLMIIFKSLFEINNLPINLEFNQFEYIF